MWKSLTLPLLLSSSLKVPISEFEDAQWLIYVIYCLDQGQTPQLYSCE